MTVHGSAEVGRRPAAPTAFLTIPPSFAGRPRDYSTTTTVPAMKSWMARRFSLNSRATSSLQNHTWPTTENRCGR